MRLVVLDCLALGLLAVLGCARAPGDPRVNGTYANLDDQATQLREHFNRAKGSGRLRFVVDPICPGASEASMT
jgi:hypothetical protein